MKFVLTHHKSLTSGLIMRKYLTHILLSQSKLKRNVAHVYLVFGIAFSVLTGCGPQYPGFEQVSENHWMKLIALGDDASQFRDQQFALMQIGLGDSLNENSIHVYKVVGGVSQCREIQDIILRARIEVMTTGEKRSFILPYQSIQHSFFDVYPDSMIQENKMIRLNVEVLKIFNDSTFANYLMNAAQLGEMTEDDAIDQLFLNDAEGVEEHGRIVVKKLVSGAGDTVKAGREVTIEYHSYLLNRLMLDSLTTLTFPFGKSGQLLSGLQYGLSLLREGDRALIYVPSDLAFGDRGSSTGIVPPRTPVYFDVRVVRVQK